jgi:hypothetical protein
VIIDESQRAAVLAARAAVSGFVPRRSRRVANPHVDALRRSWADGSEVTLAPVPACDVARTVHAVRHAAVVLDMGVRVRKESTPAGVVVRFRAAVKQR